MKQFGGSVLFLDRSDINTDEIIPVKYLTDNSKQALKPYLFEDLKLDGCGKAGHYHAGELWLRSSAGTRAHCS